MRRTCCTLACLAALLAEQGAPSAQSADQRARVTYFNARASFAKEKYAHVVRDLDRVIALLGQRKQRIVPMLATSLYRLREYARAKEEVNRYFALVPPPSRSLQEYREMTVLRAKLAPLAAAQTRLYQKARGPDLKPYRAYMSAHPNGPWAADVKRRMAAQDRANKDNAAYQRAQRSQTISGYQRYLRDYPGGRHARTARGELRRIEAHHAKLRRMRAAAMRRAEQRRRVERRRRLAKRAELFAQAKRYQSSGNVRLGLGIPVTVIGGLGVFGGLASVILNPFDLDRDHILPVGFSIIGGGLALVGVGSLLGKSGTDRRKKARKLRARARGIRVTNSIHLIPTITPHGGFGLTTLGRF